MKPPGLSIAPLPRGRNAPKRSLPPQGASATVCTLVSGHPCSQPLCTRSPNLTSQLRFHPVSLLLFQPFSNNPPPSPPLRVCEV